VFTPPLPAPPIQPVPPGGAAVPGVSQATASAPRREKARKHASQSAYAVRPAGSTGFDWFFPATGAATIAALLLVAIGLPFTPGRRPVPATLRVAAAPGRRPRAARRRNW
jgi:hypothetical protein